MKLYTFQPPEVYEALLENKVLYTDPSKIEMLIDPDFSVLFAHPYEWVRTKMGTRTENYEGHYPWWSYVRDTKKNDRPDLRTYRHYYSGPMYFLELEVPDSEVLLLPLGPWCVMLNHHPVFYTEVEDDNSPLWIDRDHDKIVETWDRALDIDAVLASESFGPFDTIQGCFEKLRLENVVKAHYFNGTRKVKK